MQAAIPSESGAETNDYQMADRPDLVGRSDLVIFQVACSEDRAVITNNIRDFRPLAAQWLAQGHVHAGLILLPSSRTRTRAAVTMLADCIAGVTGDNPGGLASSERWIGPLPA